MTKINEKRSVVIMTTKLKPFQQRYKMTEINEKRSVVIMTTKLKPRQQ